MTELELKIKDAAQRYYTDGSSPYTDEEFDAMVAELKATNSDSELLRVGWGYDVALDSTPGKKYEHKYGIAGSLEKSRSWGEMKSLQNDVVDISLKLDGLSVVLYYVKGQLVRALTRGDGKIGIDITDKVKMISDIYTSISDTSFTGAIRGEILMSFANFEEYKQVHPEAKNPRNSTAGVVNGKDTLSDLKFLSLIVYTVVGYELPGNFDHLTDVREFLVNTFGADNVVPYQKYVLLKEDTFDDWMNSLRSAWYDKYPADGLVVTSNKVLREGNSVEYKARAFKFSAEEKETEVIRVEWNMTKSHYAMPRIQVKTVELAGTTVDYCTGYNAKYIHDNKIGPGTKVMIWKANEIIPNITKVLESTEAQMIDKCPECGEELIWDGVHLKCNNSSCGNAIIQDTLIFVKTIAPVDGLSDLLILKFLNQLIDANMLEDISIESIMENSTKFNTEDSSAHVKLFNTMWNKLHNDTVKTYDALMSLNIPRLGDKTCEKLADHPAIIKKLIQQAASNKDIPIDIYYTLISVVGEATTNSIKANFPKFKRLSYLNIEYDNIDMTNVVNKKGKVAITGKLSVKRADFEKELKAAGYSVADSVNKETTFLITDNPDSSSSKNKQADKFGVTKITESEFREKYL